MIGFSPMKRTFVISAIFAVNLLVGCSSQQKSIERAILEITDQGCLVFRPVEPAPVQKLCDYENEIKPFLEQQLAGKGNKTVGVKPAASAAPSASGAKK